MKELRINKLEIKSFKGSTRVVEFNGADCLISGKNGVGKSTIMKAWFWLLSGYTDAINPKNCELYDNTMEISENTPTASVKAYINIGGYDYTISRTAKPSYSKKRGETEYTKDASDKYAFFIDDVEVTVKNFNEWIEANICPKELIQYCINGEFLANLSIDDKDKCRKVLEYIIGEIKQEDFKGDFKMLFKMMERFSIEALKEQCKQKMKLPKQRLEEIPTLIESKQEDIAQLEAVNFSENEKKVNLINQKIKEIDEELKGGAEKIKPLIEKRNSELNHIADLERELKNAESAFIEEQNSKPNKISDKIKELNEQNEKIKVYNTKLDIEYEDKKQRLELAKKDLEAYRIELELLKEKKNKIKGRVFADNKCSYCGQELPSDTIEERKNEFKETNSKELEAVVIRGKATIEKINKEKSIISQLTEELENKPTYKELISTSNLRCELDDLKSKIVDYKETEEYKLKYSSINILKANVTTIPEQNNDELTLQKSDLMAELATLNKELGQKTILERNKQELQDLIAEQKANGVALAKLQRLELEINNYIEEKANIISSRVNELLDFAKIEMQERQKNGNMTPSATICRKDGVKYSTLNGSDRILAIIDLQMMFNKYFNVSLPIFIDEASTVALSRVPSSNEWQKIYLKYEDCNFKIEKI